MSTSEEKEAPRAIEGDAERGEEAFKAIVDDPEFVLSNFSKENIAQVTREHATLDYLFSEYKYAIEHAAAAGGSSKKGKNKKKGGEGSEAKKVITVEMCAEKHIEFCAVKIKEWAKIMPDALLGLSKLRDFHRLADITAAEKAQLELLWKNIIGVVLPGALEQRRGRWAGPVFFPGIYESIACVVGKSDAVPTRLDKTPIVVADFVSIYNTLIEGHAVFMLINKAVDRILAMDVKDEIKAKAHEAQKSAVTCFSPLLVANDTGTRFEQRQFRSLSILNAIVQFILSSAYDEFLRINKEKQPEAEGERPPITIGVGALIDEYAAAYVAEIAALQ